MQRCVVLMRSARRFHRCRHKFSMCLHWHSILEFPSPGLAVRLSSPLLPQGSEVATTTKTMTVCQAGTLMGFVWPHTSRISAWLTRIQL